jgi:methyltransferase (TIGR00027 family)
MTSTERALSRTALGVAAMRAVHQIADGQPKILDDRLSERLLEVDGRDAIDRSVARASEPDGLALRTRVLLRSRFAEDRLAGALRRGVRQCVILGAGLDTFAYRQPDWAKPLTVFEIDQPASQRDKRRRLAAAGIAVPDNVRYAAIDFETTSLADGLRTAGVDFGVPTFFSCLGVLVYLTREAVDAVFQLVASFPRGSEIAFTFSSAESLSSATATRAAQAGEPWRTTFAPAELTSMLGAMGFGNVHFLEATEASQTMGIRSDALRPPRSSSIAAAIVGA